MTTSTPRDASVTRRWARLRFSIIGPLLAAPAEHGELGARIAELAGKAYEHPTTGEVIRFGASTIERWYYAARDAADPVIALARKVPSHAGTFAAMPARLAAALEAQYRAHPGWSYQLHHDNLLAVVREQPALGPPPSYPTTRRFMRHHGWLRHRKKRQLEADRDAAREARETRSFEVSHVHALWHLDFHEGSRKVLTAAGTWQHPQLLGVIDDRSRLCCHLQWYLDATADSLIHGLGQAIQKRGLPRALLTDNGAAMVAAETTEGLARLGIVHHTTLPYSPEQNAKQEVFWAQIEGRLVPMLEGEAALTLALLNEATQAWVEGEYQRRVHSELGTSPLERALAGPSVVRPSPASEELRRAFRAETTRAVRHSDGTFTVQGIRFELPEARELPERLAAVLEAIYAAYTLHWDAAEPRAGDVVTVNVAPGEAGHSATFPHDLIEPRILTSCPPGGVVLDPFSGTGRALEVALEHGRHAIGFDAQLEFVQLQKTKLNGNCKRPARKLRQ